MQLWVSFWMIDGSARRTLAVQSRAGSRRLGAGSPRAVACSVEDLASGIVARERSLARRCAASRQWRERRGRAAIDTLIYREHEIKRIARLAFAQAKERRGFVVSVDKANVLSSSRQTVAKLEMDQFNLQAQLTNLKEKQAPEKDLYIASLPLDSDPQIDALNKEKLRIKVADDAFASRGAAAKMARKVSALRKVAMPEIER